MGGKVELHSLTYAGATWELNNLDADRGVEILTKLIALMGEPLGHVGMGAAMAKSQADADGADEKLRTLLRGSVATALGTLLTNIGKVGALSVIKVLLDGLHRDQKPVDFKTYFASNYGELVRLVGWSLEINFASFFDANPLFDALTKGGQGGELSSLLRTLIGESGES